MTRQVGSFSGSKMIGSVLMGAALAASVLVGSVLVGPVRGTSADPFAAPFAFTAAQTGKTAGERAAGLVAQMTLDEKIALVHGAGYPLPPNTVGYAGMVPGNNRLGIPPLYLADSPVGVGNGATGVTQWPDSAALAASFDAGLANRYGQALGAEQAGKGNNVALSPTVNILRVPGWGRAAETFGEDPYLAGQTAAAEITGIQSQHVMATVKHFVANNQEVQRSSVNAVVAPRALAEIYEPAFRSAVRDAGVGAVMCSYNQVNGDYACQNGDTLTATLRDAWHFDGLVMSDWAGQHSTVEAANAGLDLEMPGAASDGPFDLTRLAFGSYFNTKLKSAVGSGAVALSTLDTMVTRILTAMVRIGLLEHRLATPASRRSVDVSTPAHRALATEIAESGSVLLQNKGSLLPLSPSVRSVAVIGDAADQHPVTAVGGSAAVTASTPVVTALSGITTRAVTAGVAVTHAPGTLGLAALPAIPSSAFPGGIKASYYLSPDFSGAPLFTQTLGNLDLLAGPPVGLLSTWSARYTGTLIAPATGDYRFSLSAGDAIAVSIDATPVVSFTPQREPVRNALIHLTAGRHAIQVDSTPYHANLTSADVLAVSTGLHLGWQPQEDRLIAQAATVAAAADVAVVVVADQTSEGRDRSSLALPGDQDRLIEAVAAANPHTVVVLNTSAAVLMPWLNRVSSVLETWYAGQTGGTALARLLFGDVSPSGRLPMTFPASDAQGPTATSAAYPGDGTDVRYDEGLLVGYRWFDATGQQPLFPFGFGLSYTSFGLGPVSVQRAPGSGSGSVDVTVTATNTGHRSGSEVVQLYLGFPSAAGEPPRQLKGFQRVTLAPGVATQVHFHLDQEAFSAWDVGSGSWRVVRGDYRLWVGGSTPNAVATQLTF